MGSRCECSELLSAELFIYHFKSCVACQIASLAMKKTIKKTVRYAAFFRGDLPFRLYTIALPRLPVISVAPQRFSVKAIC